MLQQSSHSTQLFASKYQSWGRLLHQWLKSTQEDFACVARTKSDCMEVMLGPVITLNDILEPSHQPASLRALEGCAKKALLCRCRNPFHFLRTQHAGSTEYLREMV